MSEHTPGPWTDHWDGEGGAFVSGGGTAIADMVGPAKFRKANARLIAAAPELLHFVEKVRDYARETDDESLYAAADDLIEKAGAA
jgi:hypothetical protein